ncbi:MAG: TIGR02757 family protein [Lentisphaerae bacterium]|nr:TIGR02757 family protein [Lentisphaerota bacterium]
MDKAVADELRRLAEKYETDAFMTDGTGDPSLFLRAVEGDANREATAFVAASLSFGSRAQFMPRIREIIDCARGDVDRWIRRGGFAADFRADDGRCFYRFFTCADMHRFFAAYSELMARHGTLGEYVRARADGDGRRAVEAICGAFGHTKPVPVDAQSACKRICMFLRWMVRSDSPVDLGLWSSFIDRRTLIMPLDVHVLSQSVRLGLLKSRCASMASAVRLTRSMAEVFPDDPLKGDFALFGYGVSEP